MEISEVTNSWEEAARTDLARVHIHPSGNISDEDYESSGSGAAGLVIDVARAYLMDRMPDIKIMDFGCGDGRVLGHVIKEFPNCLGADASPTMLKLLLERVPTATTIESNGVDGALDSLEVDLVYSWAVFIHHSIKAGQDMLVGLANSVNKGGILALQIPSYEQAHEGKAWIDVTVWTPADLKDGARRAGLQVVELSSSPGEFSYEDIGINHFRLQVFRKF